MRTLGWTLVGVGAAISLLILSGDFRRIRSGEPYAAIGLWAPEIHVVLALLTGGGSWMAWGWIAGVCVFVGHSGLGIFAADRMRRS